MDRTRPGRVLTRLRQFDGYLMSELCAVILRISKYAVLRIRPIRRRGILHPSLRGVELDSPQRYSSKLDSTNIIEVHTHQAEVV